MDCRMEVEDGRYSKPNEEWIQNDPDPCYADTPVPPPWTKPRFICCIETSFLLTVVLIFIGLAGMVIAGAMKDS